MFRRRFQSSRRPVSSIKHIIDATGALSNTRVVVPLLTAIGDDPNPFDPSKVKFGASVNGIYLSLFIIGSSGTAVQGPQDWYIGKRHAGQDVLSDMPIPGQTGLSLLRNQVIHEEKGLVGSGDGTAMAFKGVIVIPRGMRRMREGDEWFVVLRSGDNTNNPEFCLKAIFKSFS